MIEQPFINARLYLVKLAPPFWGYMIENYSDFMIAGVHLELDMSGRPYDSTPKPGWAVVHAQNDSVFWQANSVNEGAGYGQTFGFELIVPIEGDAWAIAIRNTAYVLVGYPGGGAPGEVATPAF